MKRLKKRTRVDVRAWIQGFWYQPGDITEQIKGIEAAGYKSYLVWSPSSRYDETYLALAAHQNKTFALPKYYPTLAELTGKGRSALEGVTQMVNMTDYVKGSTVLCLDRSTPERKSAYTTPRQLVDTFDEAILDAILQARGIESSWNVPRGVKLDRAVRLLLEDLGISARTMRAEPVRIAWKGDCRFYRGAGELASTAPVPEPAQPPAAEDAAAAEPSAPESGATPTS